jgi:hypothetical protein
MKRNLPILLIGIVIFITTVLFLNVTVTTRRGINYQWATIKMPLYLKILDFFDRHYNYRELVRKITKNEDNGEKKVMKIFSWTYHNIRKQPQELPVIDDHVWHIIVRGYGVSDQSSDVFTTLCNYAGMNAFYSYVYTESRKQRIPLSFVRLRGKWTVFDPYRGVYFEDKRNNLADIKAISSKDFIIKSIGKPPDFNYRNYLDNLPSINAVGLRKASIQSPLRRLIFELKKWSN